MAGSYEFTPKQKIILRILKDGERHHREELLEALTEDGNKKMRPKTLSVHLSSLRKLLRTVGQDIVCEYHARTYYYRQIRLIGD